MIFGQIPENAIKFHACEQKKCVNYMWWGVLITPENYILIKPIDSLSCEYCENFKGFHLYKEIDE